MRLAHYLTFIALLGFSNLFAQQSAFPVTLSNPMDYDTIIETEPNFIWQTNITAIQTDPRYSQRVVLCELGENQLKGDAIAVNTPILVLDDYQNTMHSYSSSATPLEEGHTYVWQVSILFNSMIVDQSEPYQFTILEPKDPLPSFYPVVFNNDGQMYQVVDDKVGLVTDELGNLKLKLQINSKGKKQKTVLLKEIISGKVQDEKEVSENSNGKRFFVLNLKGLDLKPGFYTALWQPTGKELFTFNFQVK
jgi:hypothetical protein